MPIPNHDIGGHPMRVKDCYIWSEIYYLDSPTDYRECLPPHRTRQRNVPGSGFTILESSENNSSHFFLRILVFLTLFLIICSLVWDKLQ
jgi:hypothetical protein